MISAIILTPFIAGAAALFCREKAARFLLAAGALAHLALCLAAWAASPAPGGWLMADSAGLLFATVGAVLFAVCAFYALGYLDTLASSGGRHIFSGVFGDEPEPVFIAFLLFFASSMSFVCLSRHIGLMWVALEATTLASAPLICFHRTPQSLEAAWKYLLICSVGIALALLGNFFLAAAVGAGGTPLLSDALRLNAKTLDPLWLKLAFAAAFAGYGTKMGLAPMHTWLPDAHSEAPSVVSALLSGALLNCAFLALMRVSAVCRAAGMGRFTDGAFLVFGLASVTVAAALILRQRDFKRLLAYSSVENMGIISIAAGAGSPYGALLHAVNHSFSKALLFLVSGNILRRYRSKKIQDIAGLARALPFSSVLWAAGFLAILGLPPFGPFLSKLVIIKAALGAGRYAAASVLLFMIAVVFTAVARPVMGMFRPAPQPEPAPQAERTAFIIPPLILALLALMMGVYIPGWLDSTLQSAAAALGGG